MKRNSEKGSVSDKLMPAPKRVPHWSKGLLESMEDPNMIVVTDDRIVMIRDKYPKATHHYLVLPRDDIHSLRALNGSHTQLLSHMLEVARDFVSQLSGPKLDFQYGFHASASMAQLHMHVISRDFDSVHLKTKRHWNTFTTEFFMDAQTILSALEETGTIELFDRGKCDLLLKTSLRCHVCAEELPTMPKLKIHIKKHIPK